MARHLDLGNDGYVSGCGVVYDFAYLLLGIESSVRRAVVPVGVAAVAYERLFARAAFDGQLGVALDLDAPALIVSQVPVEAVELVCGQDIYIALDLLDRKEMAAYVEHCAAICECGFVGYEAARHPAVSRHDHLAQSLQAVVYARLGAARYGYLAWRDGHFIPFGRYARVLA